MSVNSACKSLLISAAIVFDFILVAAGAAVLYVLYPAPTLPEDTVADKVVVIKHKRILMLKHNDKNLITIPVSLGRSPVGHKYKRGDCKTPEGFYILDWRNPQSCCHLSLHVSYPNKEDMAHAAIKGHDPGGNIMIHALGNGFGWVGRLHRLWDWTHGCIAVTNEEMDLIWNAVPDGTPIEILP